MRKISMMLFLLCASAAAMADSDANLAQCIKGFCDRESLSNGLFGVNKALEDKGLEMALVGTQVYQQNVRGGLSTSDKTGRNAGRLDFEINADLQKLAGIEGGSVFILTQSSWSNGINENSVGSVFNTNEVVRGNEPIAVVQLWYQQLLGGDTFAIRIGKLDLTNTLECHGCPSCFDGNRFANDELAQFLNSAFVNNPAVAFPAEGLGVTLHWNPVDWWYASFATADARGDRSTAGFNTTFDGDDTLFSIFETGILPQFESPKGPLQGAYRVGVWYNPREEEQIEEETVERNDNGFYLSFDQSVLKETSEADDTQGLGAFARYGYADKGVNDVKQFISSGLQYQGLLEGRDDDVIAAAIGYGILTDNTELTEDSQTVYEAYYNAKITRWLYITPDIQYIHHPAEADATDAVVLAVRAQMIF